jgi:Universal stress protein family
VSNAVFEIHEGDARNVLCEAVERHHADMLVVGSHGYGAIKRFAPLFFSIIFEMKAASLVQVEPRIFSFQFSLLWMVKIG